MLYVIFVKHTIAYCYKLRLIITILNYLMIYEIISQSLFIQQYYSLHGSRV